MTLVLNFFPLPLPLDLHLDDDPSSSTFSFLPKDSPPLPPPEDLTLMMYSASSWALLAFLTVFQICLSMSMPPHMSSIQIISSGRALRTTSLRAAFVMPAHSLRNHSLLR